ncbi:MAG TPA: hypothetical protein VFS20_14250 [Longimicrobium sp.]|nr:hypothetical protein [Longimicrobium sp.]
MAKLLGDSAASPFGERVMLDAAASEAVRAAAESSLASTWARMRRVPRRGRARRRRGRAGRRRGTPSPPPARPPGPSCASAPASTWSASAPSAPPAAWSPAELAPITSLVVEGMLRRAGLESCGRQVELVGGAPALMARMDASVQCGARVGRPERPAFIREKGQ